MNEISARSVTELKPRIAVHLHMFYLEQWPEISRYLSNMEDYSYDLYVTLYDAQPTLQQEITKFHPQVRFFILENRGYDVGAFIYFLHHVNLDDYDVILKLHTKSVRKGPDTHIGSYLVSRKMWKSLMLDSLLGSKTIFEKNMHEISTRPGLGMVGSKYLIAGKKETTPELILQLKRLTKEMFDCDLEKFGFVAGTMFMVRSELMKPIRDHFSFSDFGETNAAVRDGTLAHVLERLLGIAVTARGYRIAGFDTCPSLVFYTIRSRVKRFIFHSKKTKSGYRLIKICKIPVFRCKCK